MLYFLFVIVFGVLSISVLEMSSNISMASKLRAKIINEHIKSRNALAGHLSENQLISLGKIYKKKFKNNKIYKVKGVLYYGGGSSQTRWNDLAIKGMRVETIHKPYEAISISTLTGNEFLDDDSFNTDLLCDFDSKMVEICGVVHKNCLYVSKINDFDIIEELTPNFELKKTINTTKLDFGLLAFSILFYFSLIPAVSSPTNGTSIFLILCAIISTLGTMFILYYMTKGYKVSGIYKERNIYYDNQNDCKYFGTIGNTLIDSRFPLIDGKYYQAVLTDRDVGRSGLMHVEKLNGHNYEVGNANGPIKLFVFLCLQFLLAVTYYGYSKDNIQEEIIPFYNHNVEKFGEQEFSKVIRNIEDLENLEPNDYLMAHNTYYSSKGGFFWLFEGGLIVKHKSLIYPLSLSCLRGNTKNWINSVNQRVEYVKFKFDSNDKDDEAAQNVFNYREIDHEKICNERFNAAVRFALCHDCIQRQFQPIKGIVTSIDYENKVIYLTNELDLSNVPNQVARYHISIVILVSTIIYLLVGFVGITMHYEISRKNSSKDKRWVSW